MTASASAPQAIRYIKLGKNGAWAAAALEAGTIPFGYHSVSHEACLAEQWDAVREGLVATGKTSSGAS